MKAGSASIELVMHALDDLLRPLGFTRRGKTWNRAEDGLIDVVDVQISKTGTRLTVNAGVFDPAIYARVWEEEPSPLIAEPDCTVRARIGALLDGQDVWWPVEEDWVPADVASKVSSAVLQFLEKVHSRAAMEEFLAKEIAGKRYPDPPTVMYLAVLQADRGDLVGACDLLRQFRESVPGAWKDRAESIYMRIGCSG